MRVGRVTGEGVEGVTGECGKEGDWWCEGGDW